MEKLAIIGCGTMGHSIALSAAWRDIPVKMYGINNAYTDRGKLEIARKLKTLSQNGLLNGGELEQIKNRIATTTSMDEAVKKAHLLLKPFRKILI